MQVGTSRMLLQTERPRRTAVVVFVDIKILKCVFPIRLHFQSISPAKIDLRSR